MIIGAVTSRLEAIVCVYVEDGNGNSHAFDTIVDTGFSGFLTLPPSAVATLALTWEHDTKMVLADGSSTKVDVYSAVVIWDGQPRTIRVNEVDFEPLLGMRLLAGHEVRIRVVDGGLVWIDVVP